MTHVPQVVVGEGVIMDTGRVSSEGLHVSRVENFAGQALL